MIKNIKSLQVALILILFMLALIIQFPATVSQQWLESNHIKVNGINGTNLVNDINEMKELHTMAGLPGPYEAAAGKQ